MLDAASLSPLSGRTVTADQAGAAVAVVTALARSYTRGNGFADDEPAEDLQAAIATAVLRLLVNPTGTQQESMGAISVTFGPKFLGWSLTEMAALNRWRDRAR
jgi:hypothetical protein